MPRKLTKAAIAALAPRAKTYIEYDTVVAKLGIRVTPAGARSWTYEFRPGGGRRAAVRRMTLAAADKLSPEKARRQAKRLAGMVALGGDPAADRDERRTAATIEELADQFMREEINTKRKPRTAELYEHYFENHIIPKIGTKRARDVTRDDLARLHVAIGKTAQPTANRVLTLLSGLYTWAGSVDKSLKNINPAKGIRHFDELSKERFLDTAELGRLAATLTELETIGLAFEIDAASPNAKHNRKPENRRVKVSPFATNAIRLLLFTGCRLREILHLRWDDVHLELGSFTLHNSKTGRREVLLNAPALTVLDELSRIRLGEFVIAGDRAGTADEKPRADLAKPWRQVIKHAELAGVTLHTLRHTHAATGVDTGFGLPVIGALLGHRQASTTAKYAHVGDTVARRASNAIGAQLAAAMGDAGAGDGGEIIPFKRPR